jgi:hypothetical protein
MRGIGVTEQRVEEVLKSAVMVILDLLPPDQRPIVFARVSGQVMEKLSRISRPSNLPKDEP